MAEEKKKYSINSIFESSHDAFIVSDDKMNILSFNRSACRIFGYTPEEMTSLKIPALMPEERIKYYHDDIKNADEGKVVTNVVSGEIQYGKKKDGTVFRLELTYLRSDEKNRYISQIRDISERVKYENQLKFSQRILEIINDCNKIVNTVVSEKEYCDEICRIIVRSGGFKSTLIGMKNRNTESPVDIVAYEGCMLKDLNEFIFSIKEDGLNSNNILEYNNENINIVNIADDKTNDPFSKLSDNIGIRSLISVPLNYDGDKAVLLIMSETVKEFDTDNKILYYKLSQDISSGLQTIQIRKAGNSINNSLLEKEKQLIVLNRLLKTINECSKSLLKSKNTDEYLNNICKVLVETGRYNACSVQLVSKTSGGFRLNKLYLKGDLGSFFKNEFSPNITGLTEKTIKNRSSFVSQNIKDSGNYIYWSESPDMMNFESTASIPIIRDKKILGVLRLYSEEKHGFAREELSYLEDISRDIAYGVSSKTDMRQRVMMENDLTKSHKLQKVLNRALRIINESNKALVSSDSMQQYLNRICTIITEIGGYKRSMIMLIDEKDRYSLIPFAHSRFENISFLLDIDKNKNKVNIEHGGPTGIACRKKTTQVRQNIKESGLYKYWADKPDDIKFDSTIAVPLTDANGEVLEGVLRVFSVSPDSFENKEVKLLEELGRDIVFGIKTFRNRAAFKTAKQELTESEERYKTLIQSASDAIFIADVKTGKIVDANKTAEQLIGKPLEEIIGMYQSELHPSDLKDYHEEIFSRHSTSEHTVIDEGYVIKSNGKKVPVQINASTVNFQGQKLVQGIFRDVTEIKSREEKVRLSQKMEALGTLSGGIAHDFNNILSPVIGFTQLALIESEDREKVNYYLNEVLTASNRAKELVNRILSFTKKSDSEMKPHRIQKILHEVIKLVSLSLPSNISLQTCIDDDCGSIICDPIQIYQIVINLCTNAYQAMNDGGTLKVSYSRADGTDLPSELKGTDISGMIVLKVSDTGEGMNSEVITRIYEPYFTTKSQDEGTGLGLSVVMGIVNSHNARIFVESKKGEGSTFTVVFKSSDEHDRKTDSSISSKVHKKKKVMVVDDELQITFMLKNMLKELGMEPFVFNNSEKALEDFRKSPDKYDLIITDQTMPGLLGTEFCLEILKLHPGMPIILNTGYSSLISKKEALNMGISEFIMKPFTLTEISYAVDKVLSS